MTDQPRIPAHPVRVSVPGTRTDTGAARTLLAIRETTGTWMIHSLNSGAVWLTEEQATRMATADPAPVGRPR